MSFSVTGAHVCVVLFYFGYPFVGQGLVAGLWILLASGGSILQGLGRWPIIGLFLAPDLHL